MTIAEKITRAKTDYDEVFEAGFEKGKAEGGGDSYYIKFWNDYLNPVPFGWSYKFAGYGWNNKTFRPPVDIVPTGSCTLMFGGCGIMDLKGLCEELDIRIDFSKATGLPQIFSDSRITTVGEIDTRSASNINYILYNARSLISVDKIILKDDGSQTTNANSFFNAIKLENIIFEGVIGQNGFNFQWSTLLSKASIISIINCLSTTTSGLTVTLSKTAVETAFGSTTSAEWTTLIGTRSNWTISLV